MKPKRPLLMSGGFLVALFAGLASAQETVGDAIDIQQQSIEASASTQQRINALDDDTRDMLNEYR